MIDSVKNYRVIDALFFLFLGSSGTIGANISSCRLRKNLEKNPYLRHFIFFIIIYFTNSIIQDNTIKDSFINTGVLYSMFIILMRNDYRVIIMVVSLLFIHKITTQYVLESIKTSDNVEGGFGEAGMPLLGRWNRIEYLEKFNKYLIHLGVTIMVLGFLYNMFNKHKKFGSSFNILEYIFQNVGCKK